MNTPKPSSPIPFYGREIDLPKVFVNGKEVPYKCKIVHGEVDTNTMTFRKYTKKGEDNNDNR